MFQSTCPCGARPRPDPYQTVSIHVPVWGTTCFFSNSKEICKSFNPRARVGHDAIALYWQTPLGFQSTCPCGARLGIFLNPLPLFCFNPRARVGHDFSALVLLVALFGFQSTCPCGARLLYFLNNSVIMCFNPRARVGHDISSLVTITISEFQSTCPCGARQFFAG